MRTVTQERRGVSPGLARRLILDEVFDLSLYQALHGVARGRLREVLAELIPIELKHVAFWREFFRSDISALDLGRRIKLRLILVLCRLFGEPAVHLVLEAIEVYGVRKYLVVWEAYREGPLGDAVQRVLEDEFRHEDRVVAEVTDRRINPQRIRDVFLGLNDGLVEILGAVSGFFGAFSAASTVFVAGLTVAVAGALSMGAGAYLASSSEAEVQRTARARARFLGEGGAPAGPEGGPVGSGVVVGASYLVGAMVPLLPVLLGARTLLWPAMAAGATIAGVSFVLAFLTGMEVRRRIGRNLAITATAVAVTYAIGRLAQRLFGVPA